MKDIYTVELSCPVCGGTLFEKSESSNLDENIYKCHCCGYSSTKEQVIEANKEKIDSTIEDIKDEASKEFKKMLKEVAKGWK